MAIDKNVENQVDEVLNAAEAEEDGTYTHKLRKPFEYDGITHEEFTFDWDSLTGHDFIAISSEIGSSGAVVMLPALDTKFQLRVACRACTKSIGTDVLSALPFKDLMVILGKARSFMLRSEL